MSKRYPHLRGNLHEYQHKLRADRSPVRLVKKSRRIGVSYCAIGQAVGDACRSLGRNTYYMTHTHWGGREAMRDVARWGDFYNAFNLQHGWPSIWIDGNKRKSMAATKCTFASGHTFQVLASSPRLLRGAPDAPHYLLDEVEFHRDPEGMLDAASAVLLLRTASITMISTVNGEGPFWRWCEEVKAGKMPYSLHEITFRDALADGLYERIVVDVKRSPFVDELLPVDDPDLARALGVPHKKGARDEYHEQVRLEVTDPLQELDCIPRSAGDQYFPPKLVSKNMDANLPVIRWCAPDDEWKWVENSVRQAEISGFIDAHIQPVLELHRRAPPRSWFVGTDFGRSRDLTAQTWGYNDGARLKGAFILELEDCPWKDQEFFFDQIKLRMKPSTIRRAATDKGGPGGPLAEHIGRELGPTVAEGVMTGQDTWDREWFPELRKALEQRTIVIPHDPFVIADLGQVRLASNGVPKVPRQRTRQKATGMRKARFRHADTAVSLCLFVYAARGSANQGGYGVTTDDDLDTETSVGLM